MFFSFFKLGPSLFHGFRFAASVETSKLTDLRIKILALFFLNVCDYDHVLDKGFCLGKIHVL